MNGLEIFLAITVLLCLAYGIDDLFIDAIYWLRLLFRQFKRKQIVPLEAEKLNAEKEQRIAIMVPCWHENDVVGASLRNTMFTLQYANYNVFVGVYPNDPETLRVVKTLKESLPNVHYAMCPNPGPTSKADNLNAMYAEILKFEKEQNTRFDVFVIHDAEDVIHPLSLKLTTI
jgi:adsorption protein B